MLNIFIWDRFVLATTNAFFFLALHSLCLSLALQAQYVFIHDSLSELVMCGETEVGATNFRIKMNELQKPIAGDPSGPLAFRGSLR